jgi:hypothetical protein
MPSGAICISREMPALPGEDEAEITLTEVLRHRLANVYPARRVGNLPSESHVQTKDQIPQSFTLFPTITDTSALDSERNHSVD